SAQDADSEGSEGKFYLWTERQLSEALGESDAKFARQAFRTSPGGNFEESTNILRLADDVDLLDPRLLRVQSALLAARVKRVPPQTDDKVLTDWNGLMIAAYAQAGAAFGEERWTARAAKASGFILKRNADSSGQLLHQYRGGKSAGVGGLDDYAFIIWGLTDLYQADFDPIWLAEAKRLANVMKDTLADQAAGGFYMAPTGDKYALTRPKTAEDAALPSGNAVAALDLVRLGRLIGDPQLESLGRRTVLAFGTRIRGALHAFPTFAVAADYVHGPGN
ncbi:MAG: thioredoxin domain-containing protein, partial [Fimbriimonas ginsengisoli]|nr:thioredoxin domain-containing protein [Fimbriimonas ginsengisoli]